VEAATHPGKSIEAFAADEHRIGLKPVARRVLGARRRASARAWPSSVRLSLRHAFASPATGETFWYLSNGVSEHQQDDASDAGFGLAREGRQQSLEEWLPTMRDGMAQPA
jgi:hypothetical protein